MTVAVYLRVSSEDQNPESQRADIQRWLDQNGITSARWFEDKETGRNLNRPEYQKLSKQVRQGKIKTVVCWKLDRLSRSFKDGVRLIADWSERDVRIVSATQPIDLSGIMGQLFATVYFALAEMELNHLRERQAAGIAVAKAEGKYKGGKAGYRKAQPERVLELRANGLTVKEIASSLNVNGRTVSRYLQSSGGDLILPQSHPVDPIVERARNRTDSAQAPRE